MRRFIYLAIFLLITSFEAQALDYEVIDVVDENGQAIEIGKIRFMSAHHLFTTEMNDQEMVELSGLAWSEDEQRLYAISDHGSIFHFDLTFTEKAISGIRLANAYALKDVAGDDLSYPYSDSEGLHIVNANNGIPGDEELLVSFENKPRLQWHKPDGTFLKRGKLPSYLEKHASYYRRTKALESVTIHPDHGVLTVPEKPLEDAEWDEVVLYAADGGQFSLPRDSYRDASVCAIEILDDGQVLLLKRKHRLLAPTWEIELQRASIKQNEKGKIEPLMNIKVGDAVPVDNYEGLTRHKGNRFLMISDNNEHFMQRTVLVYFELIN